MATHNIHACLQDILDRIERIDTYLDGKRDFNLYRESNLLRDAIDRNLSIIGEATNRILKIDANYPIDNARKIVDMRNMVVHAYDALDDETVWLIIVKHLPALREEVDRLLNP